jgi:tetratricopeptide (TPR) repeat protein
MQGRADEVLPLLTELEESVSVPETNLAVTAGIAALAASAGLVDPARSALSRLMSKGLERLTSSSVWMVSLLGICEAAHALGDVEAAREGYRLLAPFAELPVMASLGVACFGSAHRPLGLAAWAMGDFDLALEHLEKAALADLALENRPCHAITLATLADVIDAAGQSAGHERAAKLRAAAAQEASDCGMKARAKLWARPAASPLAVTCQRHGRVWLVSAKGRSASVPHSVGMGYLAELFAHPDVEIPAIDLASSYAFPHGRGAEPVLDPAAKASYLRRIQEFRQEIEEAEYCADLERASRARAQFEALVDALARATGLRGRPRELEDEGERARVSVRKAIARALGAIADADPDLGSELHGRVITGARCIFDSRGLEQARRSR